jgi:hypothetical protein
VLSSLCIEYGDGVAVSNSNNSPLDRLRVCSDGERDRYIAARRRVMESETFGSLKVYMTLAGKLVASASKDDLVECARILALNAAHYAGRYGELPIEGHLDFLHA